MLFLETLKAAEGLGASVLTAKSRTELFAFCSVAGKFWEWLLGWVEVTWICGVSLT